MLQFEKKYATIIYISINHYHKSFMQFQHPHLLIICKISLVTHLNTKFTAAMFSTSHEISVYIKECKMTTQHCLKLSLTLGHQAILC